MSRVLYKPQHLKESWERGGWWWLVTGENAGIEVIYRKNVKDFKTFEDYLMKYMKRSSKLNVYEVGVDSDYKCKIEDGKEVQHQVKSKNENESYEDESDEDESDEDESDEDESDED